MANPYPESDQAAHAIYKALAELGPTAGLLSATQLTDILEKAVRAREADRKQVMTDLTKSVVTALHVAGYSALDNRVVDAIKKGILDPVTFRYIVLDYIEPPTT